MTGRLDIFDVCVCGHRRLQHDEDGCQECGHQLRMRELWLSLPATAHLEAELPAPVVCTAFVEARHGA